MTALFVTALFVTALFVTALFVTALFVTALFVRVLFGSPHDSAWPIVVTPFMGFPVLHGVSGSIDSVECVVAQVEAAPPPAPPARGFRRNTTRR